MIITDDLPYKIEVALNRFRIKKNYKGYPYLVGSIQTAINCLPERLTMEELSEQLAKSYEVPQITICRELTRMTNSLWRYLPNITVYEELIGQSILTQPLPLEFIYSMTYIIKNN